MNLAIILAKAGQSASAKQLHREALETLRRLAAADPGRYGDALAAGEAALRDIAGRLKP